PVWNGPDIFTIWTQGLTQASLATSLLVAFGAVLAKQWLSYIKPDRGGPASKAATREDIASSNFWKHGVLKLY
ncbi:hypothetical protein M422DRAFT_182003, partial [Sphaerobolus stellatus SS14]